MGSSRVASAEELPVAVDSLRAELVTPVSARAEKRFFVEIRLALRGVDQVPRGADVEVGAACVVEEKPVRDSGRLRAVNLHTLRPRQRRSFRIALFAKQLLHGKPKQCEIRTRYLDTYAKRSIPLSSHCLRNGETSTGNCSTKKGGQERPRLVAERSRK